MAITLASRLRPVVGACFALTASFAAAWPFTVDDAYIAATYAHRLASGLGYTFRDGAVTDGVTGPLWLVPLTLGARAGVDPVSVAKLLGALFAGVAVAIVIASLRHGARGAQAAWVGAGLCVTSVPLAVWPVAGLETGAAVLAASVLLLAVVARPEPWGHTAGLASALLAWLRPELAPFVIVLLLGAFSHDRERGLRACAWAMVGAVSVVAFRYFMFGHVLPMSAAAKPAELAHGTRYALKALARPTTWLALSLLAAGLMRAPRRDRLVVSALFAHLVGIVLAGGDWMPGLRLLAPVVPSFAWLFARASTRGAFVRRPVLSVGLCVLLIGLRAAEVVREVDAARAAGIRAARTARQFANLADARDTIVALDVGALAYCARAQVVDLGGLTEPRVAYAHGGHLNKRVDPAWLAATNPRLILLHSRERPRIDEAGHLRWFAGYPVERRVLTMPWVMRGYVATDVIEHAPDYFYVVLRRRGDSKS